MEDKYPLLFFPAAQHISPPKGKAMPIGQPNVPSKATQMQRLVPQLQLIEDVL